MHILGEKWWLSIIHPFTTTAFSLESPPANMASSKREDFKKEAQGHCRGKTVRGSHSARGLFWARPTRMAVDDRPPVSKVLCLFIPLLIFFLIFFLICFCRFHFSVNVYLVDIFTASLNTVTMYEIAIQ